MSIIPGTWQDLAPGQRPTNALSLLLQCPTYSSPTRGPRGRQLVDEERARGRYLNAENLGGARGKEVSPGFGGIREFAPPPSLSSIPSLYNMRQYFVVPCFVEEEAALGEFEG